ncbi:MAG: GreA/GreB family elongation factor, partial [Bacteroidetes bacterium]|nr:GreA/GreB family elongation factor [Bacteroidota bacterium]
SLAVGEGSLIQLKSGTNSPMIYLAAAMGNLKFNGQSLHVISLQSPLGIALIGKKKGDSFKFNTIHYSIEELQ